MMGSLNMLWFSCSGEAWTVWREGVNMRFFSGDGVVKNVPEDKPAVFEVCDSAQYHSIMDNSDLHF